MTAPAPPFSRLLAEHHDALYRFLVASVGRQDAADCLQEATIAALRAYPPRKVDCLKGWLFTIAYRKAIDHHRSANRRPIPVERTPERPTSDPEVADGVLWDAVRRLPDKQRDAVLLRYVADLPYAEVGRFLECTDAAARQNVRAGLAALRAEVER